MTIPDVYPEIAPTNRDININVEASSPIEGVTIDDVTLFFIASDSELDITKPKMTSSFTKVETAAQAPIYPWFPMKRKIMHGRPKSRDSPNQSISIIGSWPPITREIQQPPLPTL